MCNQTSNLILKDSEKVTTAADVLAPNVTRLKAGVVMVMQYEQVMIFFG